MKHIEKRISSWNVPAVMLLLLPLWTAAVLSGCGSGTQSCLALAPVGTQVQDALAPSSQTPSLQEGGVLLIYICGEVKSPGVYELAAGSRICDAVEAAGGMTDAADREYWNLAEPLSDGQMLCFPTEEEAKSRKEAAADGRTADGRVNLNTAGLEELMTIPGVGKTRGEAILAYRREHGAFEEPQDITKVSGIGEATYEKMKDCIAVK